MKLRMAPLTAISMLALAGVNGWLLTVVMHSHEPLVQEPAMAAPSAPRTSEPASSQLAIKPPSDHREILARPLFHKTREPFAPPPAPPPPAAVKPPPPPPPADPGISLGGVAIDSAMRKAYLFNKGAPQGTWVSQGETFMGWTVQAIDANGAKLRQADRTLDLPLYERRQQ